MYSVRKRDRDMGVSVSQSRVSVSRLSLASLSRREPLPLGELRFSLENLKLLINHTDICHYVHKFNFKDIS